MERRPKVSIALWEIRTVILYQLIHLVSEIKQKQEEEEMRQVAVTALVSGLGVVGFVAGSMGAGVVSIPVGLGLVILGGFLKRRSE